MRGNLFHNYLVQQTKMVLIAFGWQVYPEYCIQRNGVITYFDLLANKDHFLLGLEIETTARHIIDNAVKANAVGIDVWFILPTRNLRKKARKKLATVNIRPTDKNIQLLLPGQVAQALTDYLSPTIAANSYEDR